MRHIRTLTVVAVALASAGLSVSPASAVILPTTSPPIAVVAGALPSFAAEGATVTVLGVPSLAGATTGQSFPYTVLASGPAAGANFSLTVPNSAALDALVPGAANTNVVVSVRSGNTVVDESTALPLGRITRTGPLGAFMGVSATAAVPTVALAPFNSPPSIPASAATTLPPSGPTTTAPAITVPARQANIVVGCTTVLISSVEDQTRIGELHVANEAGVTGTYAYSNTADSTFSVGYSGSTSGFSFGGTVSVTNSIGSGGSVAHFGNTGGWSKYVDSHLYYGLFQNQGPLCSLYWGGTQYIVQAYDAVGDVYDGPNPAPFDPTAGGCRHDTNGYATVAAHTGMYFTQGQQAANYGTVAQVFGFNFSGSTGYSSTTKITWTDTGPVASYVCGNQNVNTSPVLWNNP